MRKKVILITGASGEIGDALIHSLADHGKNEILTLDVRPLSSSVAQYVTHIQGDILDKALLARLVSEYEIDTIYHLAALLSTHAEYRQFRHLGTRYFRAGHDLRLQPDRQQFLEHHHLPRRTAKHQ